MHFLSQFSEAFAGTGKWRQGYQPENIQREIRGRIDNPAAQWHRQHAQVKRPLDSSGKHFFPPRQPVAGSPIIPSIKQTKEQ